MYALRGLTHYDVEKLEELLGVKPWIPAKSLTSPDHPLVPPGHVPVLVMGNGIYKRALKVVDYASWRQAVTELWKGHYTACRLYFATPAQLIQCPYKGTFY